MDDTITVSFIGLLPGETIEVDLPTSTPLYLRPDGATSDNGLMVGLAELIPCGTLGEPLSVAGGYGVEDRPRLYVQGGLGVDDAGEAIENFLAEDEAQEGKATAARIEAALNTINEASNGLIVQYGGGCIYQPAEIEAWVWVDGAELIQLGAAILAGEEDAYSLWAAQCGETLWTPRGASVETASLEVEVRGLK